MKKFRLYWDTEKETAWLNQMAQEGWNATKFFMGVYTFEKCEPGEYQFQIDTKDKGTTLSNKYRDFMEEVGIEVAFTWGVWVVLRKKTSDGDFQLFTDDESRLDHYKKILRIYKVCTIIELFCMMVNLIPGVLHNSTMNYICALIIGAILVLFFYLIFITKSRIAKIRQSQGDTESKTPKSTQSLVSIGWLFMLCSYLLNDRESTVFVVVRIAVILVALALFITAIAKSQTK